MSISLNNNKQSHFKLNVYLCYGIFDFPKFKGLVQYGWDIFDLRHKMANMSYKLFLKH